MFGEYAVRRRTAAHLVRDALHRVTQHLERDRIDRHETSTSSAPLRCTTADEPFVEPRRRVQLADDRRSVDARVDAEIGALVHRHLNAVHLAGGRRRGRATGRRRRSDVPRGAERGRAERDGLDGNLGTIEPVAGGVRLVEVPDDVREGAVLFYGDA